MDERSKFIILIAEDDEGHAKLIKKNIIASGVTNEIITLNNGEKVLDYIYENLDKIRESPRFKYILLLDIRMPKVDGIEVLEKIKSHKDLKKIPVIMITTTDDPKEIEECYFLGCNYYINKPVDYEKFVEVIAKLGSFIKTLNNSDNLNFDFRVLG
jgi:CheY-like chemotaxis protein